MQAGAARVEEALQALVAGGRAELERRAVVQCLGCLRPLRPWAREQEGDVGLLARDVLARPGGQAEQAREVLRGGVTIGDGDGDVVDALDLDH